jgi:hypothetical protein
MRLCSSAQLHYAERRKYTRIERIIAITVLPAFRRAILDFFPRSLRARAPFDNRRRLP